MSLTATIGTTVDEVLALVDELEEITYGGMDLRTHALTCGGLAVAADADDTLVTAALLHDIGRARYLAKAAPGIPHEEVGRRFVEERFGERAGWLVAQHEAAGRYLASVDEAYVAGLPRASRGALRRQGGALSATRVAAFEAGPWAADVVALRRWDDAALAGEGAPAAPADLAPALRASWVA